MNTIKQLLAVSAISLAIAGCSGTSPSSDQQQAATPTTPAKQSVDLAIEKYQLSNGLEVVLHQDKSDPIVAAAIVYHVGSNREKPGRTGFAHFFEHMLFQDSEHVGAGNFIKNIGNMGGILNGGTWQDGTIYYEVVPKDGLEKVLWMESDRMGYFINTLTQAGLENEKQVVKNEKRQGVDNRPYGHTDYVTLKALYPPGHPYSWDVIGSLEDLQNATLADVREFYQKWYGVNNATLVLAGDFDNDQAKQWIKKYFGQLPSGEKVTPLPPMPTTLAHSKSLYHEDNFATVPELTLTLPTIQQYSKQSYALQLLADLLADGKDSVFYQQLVEQDKVAPSVQVRSHNAEIAGTFAIKVRAFADTDLDRVKTSIDKALQRFADQGFSDKQLARIMTSRETGFYNELTSVFNKAASLAQHNEFGGDPALVTQEIEHFRQITRADIMAVFKQYILNKNTVATSFVPKGKVALALKGAIKADVVEEQIVQGAEQTLAAQGEQDATPMTPLAQNVSNIDRSVNPPFAGKLTIELPQVWQQSLANGVRVLGIEHNELPLVSFSIRVMGGHLLDQPGKSGVANLLTGIMMQGTKNKTPQQLEDALGALGAQLKFTTGAEFITLSGSTLTTNFAATMALAQEILLQPRWDERQWQRIKQQTRAQIIQSKANPNAIAANVYASLMYDPNSMLSKPVAGTVAELQTIELADVKAFYQRNIVASLTTVHVAGDINAGQTMAALQPLATGLVKGDVSLPKPISAIPISQPTLYFVDVPGAKQSVINIGQRAMAANADDYYTAVAVNHNLGGSFSGQLFQILRLQKGYTYGAYSGFNRSNGGGVFTARSSVRSNVTLESVQTLRQIMFDYVKNFDQHALDASKSILTKSNARAFETTQNLLGVLQNISSYRLANDYVKQQLETLNALTLEEAQKVLKTYINPDHMLYLIVGDATTQLPRIKALGLGQVVQLDVHGQPLLN